MWTSLRTYAQILGLCGIGLLTACGNAGREFENELSGESPLDSAPANVLEATDAAPPRFVTKTVFLNEIVNVTNFFEGAQVQPDPQIRRRISHDSDGDALPAWPRNSGIEDLSPETPVVTRHEGTVATSATHLFTFPGRFHITDTVRTLDGSYTEQTSILNVVLPTDATWDEARRAGVPLLSIRLVGRAAMPKILFYERTYTLEIAGCPAGYDLELTNTAGADSVTAEDHHRFVLKTVGSNSGIGRLTLSAVCSKKILIPGTPRHVVHRDSIFFHAPIQPSHDRIESPGPDERLIAGAPFEFSGVCIGGAQPGQVTVTNLTTGDDVSFDETAFRQEELVVKAGEVVDEVKFSAKCQIAAHGKYSMTIPCGGHSVSQSFEVVAQPDALRASGRDASAMDSDWMTASITPVSQDEKPMAIELNEPANFVGRCTGGRGEPVFHWSVIDPKKMNVATGVVNENMFEFTPSTAGEYTLRLVCTSGRIGIHSVDVRVFAANWREQRELESARAEERRRGREADEQRRRAHDLKGAAEGRRNANDAEARGLEAARQRLHEVRARELRERRGEQPAAEETLQPGAKKPLLRRVLHKLTKVFRGNRQREAAGEQSAAAGANMPAEPAVRDAVPPVYPAPSPAPARAARPAETQGAAPPPYDESTRPAGFDSYPAK